MKKKRLLITKQDVAIVPIFIAIALTIFVYFRPGRVRGQINSSTEINSAIEALKTSENNRVRSLAALNLGQLKSDSPEILAALIFALDDRDEIVRLRATVALIEIGTPAIPSLVAGLKHEKERVREQADFAIAKILTDEQQIQPDCIYPSQIGTINQQFIPVNVLTNVRFSGFLKRADNLDLTTNLASRSSHCSAFEYSSNCSPESLSRQELNAAIANLKVALDASNFSDDTLQQKAHTLLQESLANLKREKRDRLREAIPKWLLVAVGAGIVVFCLFVPFENFAKRNSPRSPE